MVCNMFYGISALLGIVYSCLFYMCVCACACTRMCVCLSVGESVNAWMCVCCVHACVCVGESVNAGMRFNTIAVHLYTAFLWNCLYFY